MLWKKSVLLHRWIHIFSQICRPEQSWPYWGGKIQAMVILYEKEITCSVLSLHSYWIVLRQPDNPRSPLSFDHGHRGWHTRDVFEMASTTALNTFTGSRRRVVPLSTMALSLLYWEKEREREWRERKMYKERGKHNIFFSCIFHFRRPWSNKKLKCPPWFLECFRNRFSTFLYLSSGMLY